MAQRKTRLDTQIPTVQTPTWVDTTWVQKTPELMATQKVSKLWSNPVAWLDGQFKTTADIVSPQPPTMVEKQAQQNPQNAFDNARARWLEQIQTSPQPPQTTAEKTTVTTPEWTTTTVKETPQTTAITKDTNWQDVQNKDLNSLEQLVEARYGTVATQKDGKLQANVWGKNFEWSLQNGQPVKTEIQDPVTTGLINKYITASSDEIYNGFINGEIPSSIETQITANPNYAIAKEKFRKKISADNTNKITETVFNAVTWTEPTVKDRYQEASDKIVERERAKWKTDAEIADYATFLWEDKELTRYVENLNAKNKQYNELQNIAQNNAKNIMKANPWITETSAILLAARQNEPLNQQMESLSYEIQNLQANINYREKINEVAYQERQQLAQEQRQFDRQIELQKQSQLLQTGDLNSTDPYIQQRGIETAVNQLYQQYPIPWMEAPATKIEKVKQMIVQGMTPQQAISQLEQEIRATDRYKNYINPPVAQTESWQKLTDNSLYNQETWEVKNVWDTWMTANVSVQTDPQWVINYAKNLKWDVMSCWQFTNSYIQQLTGTYGTMWDTLESKNKTLADIGVTNAPVIWGLFTLDTGTREWHTWVIQSINWNEITVIEANREWGATGKSEPKIWTYTISDKMRFSQAPKTYDTTDISVFNSLTPSEKKKMQNDPNYNRFNDEKKQIMQDPDASIYDIMSYSEWGKDMWEERLKSLWKFWQALSQLTEIQKKITDTTTWPIIWRLRSYNPYDANAQSLISEINALIPNLARWVYWEVWVLTDFDIANYAKTVPNIKSTEDTNKLVLAMTLKTMINWFKTQLQIDWSAWRDVSWFVWTVKQYENTVDSLLNSIWQWGTKWETLAPWIDPMWKVPTKQWEFTNQDLLDTYNELLKDNTPQEVDQYFSEYFWIPITR